LLLNNLDLPRREFYLHQVREQNEKLLLKLGDSPPQKQDFSDLHPGYQGQSRIEDLLPVLIETQIRPAKNGEFWAVVCRV